MQEQTHKRVGIIRLTLSLILIVVATWVFLNRQSVVDHWTVWQYQPNEEVQQLVKDSAMSESGEFYFYVSQPEINDRQTFNSHCTSAGEQTVVLGCYSAQRIYIFDVQDERLDGIKEVTAAHEMLHAVYDRLSRSEKERINALLEKQLDKVTDQRVHDLIAVYERAEPGEKHNELHSLFATELSVLSEELEEYYGRYFADRSVVVKLSQQYEGVFHSMKERQNQLIDELNTLATSITNNTHSYNQSIAVLNQDIQQFNKRANSGGYSTQAEFDADRQALLARQQTLVVMRSEISDDISEYDEKLLELESVNGQVEQLNQSINSNALEPAPSL